MYFKCGTKMETSSLTNIGDMRKKRHGLFKNYANIFCVGLGRREDEINNNSDLSLFNFRLLCNIRSPFTRSLNLPCKPLGTTFAHIFLFLDVRIPANALCRPIRTKFLYYITSSHAPVIAFVSQNILKMKRYGQRLTQGYSLDGGCG